MRTKWAYLPYSMHMAGPREAIQHMLIRKNFGCTHFIIGRDMAGSKSSVDGEDFYGAFEAQDFAKANSEELGVVPVPSLNLVCTGDDTTFEYLTADEAKEKGLEVKKLSGTKFRQMLRAGDDPRVVRLQVGRRGPPRRVEVSVSPADTARAPSAV